MQVQYPAILFMIVLLLIVNPVSSKTGEEWFDIGNIYFKNASYSQAIEAWSKAIGTDPSLAPNAWYNIGLAYAGMEQYETAVQAWDITLNLVPYSAIAYDNKGTALALLGRYDDAMIAYENALAIQPDNQKFKADKMMLFETMKQADSQFLYLIIIAIIIIIIITTTIMIKIKRNRLEKYDKIDESYNETLLEKSYKK